MVYVSAKGEAYYCTGKYLLTFGSLVLPHSNIIAVNSESISYYFKTKLGCKLMVMWLYCIILTWYECAIECSYYGGSDVWPCDHTNV